MPADRHRVRLHAADEPLPAAERPRSPDGAFRLLVLGDFSGRGRSRDVDAPAPDRPALSVDRDDFDAVLGRIAPELRLTLEQEDGRQTIAARFERLRDFHPDELLRRLDAFDELLELRRGLAEGEASPATGETDAGTEEDDARKQGRDRPDTSDSGGGLLDQVVRRTEGPAGEPAGSGSEDRDPSPTTTDESFARYLRELVEPHLVREEAPDAASRQALDRLDGLLASALRALLHHPAFQSLEATWRGLRFLVDRVETGADAKIRVLDVSRGELALDLERAARGDESLLRRRLVEDGAGTPGAAPWTLLVGLHAFGADDLRLLRGIGALARAAGAPFLAGASPELAGLSSLSRRPERTDWDDPGEGWNALRRSEVAPWLGLALPRLLLRLPYGPDQAPCEHLDFREMTTPPRHEDYLWGSPALPCAALMARSFAEDGWSMRPGTRRQLDRLPLHVYSVGDDARAKPCAEMLMSDSVATELMDRGFMPLASIKERDAVRVVRFQSIADPPAALAGRWST